MAPLRGWGPRLEAQAPHGHWRTLTFIAALRHDRVSAPWVIDGPINGLIFRRYVESVLVPTLKSASLPHMQGAVRARPQEAQQTLTAMG